MVGVTEEAAEDRKRWKWMDKRNSPDKKKKQSAHISHLKM